MRGLQQGLDRQGAVKEILEHCNACARYGSMSGGVAGVSWRALRESLRQQAGAKLRESFGDCLRIEGIRVQMGCRLRHRILVRKMCLQQGAVILRTRAQVDDPLVKP